MTYLSVMLSNPTAKPISICPALILFEMSVTAMSPEEHHRLIVCNGTVSGMPAARAALRAWYGAPAVSTVPTVMSPIVAGSILECVMACYHENT